MPSTQGISAFHCKLAILASPGRTNEIPPGLQIGRVVSGDGVLGAAAAVSVGGSRRGLRGVNFLRPNWQVAGPNWQGSES